MRDRVAAQCGDGDAGVAPRELAHLVPVGRRSNCYASPRALGLTRLSVPIIVGPRRLEEMIGRDNLPRDPRPRPRQDQPGDPGVGEGLDPERMQARRQGDGPDPLAHGMDPSVIDDQSAIEPELRAVLRAESEPVVAGGGYLQETCLPHREAVGEPGIEARPGAAWWRSS